MMRARGVITTALARICFLVSALAGFTVANSSAGQDNAPVLTGPAAFQQALPGLTPDKVAAFREGAGVFRAAWLSGPSVDTPRFVGLGPLFNRRSCVACHIGNGRGEPPLNPADAMRSLLIRLSIPGAGEHGSPRPHPVYGDQLQTDAVVGFVPEGRPSFKWRETNVRLADGTKIGLRAPEILIRDLAHGPLPADIELSARISPAVYGLGLLEAVPEETLAQLGRSPMPDGIRGRLNRVWDTSRQTLVPGRFGLKANQPSLRQQIAAALLGDMGITSHLQPIEACPPPVAKCSAATTPEVSLADFEALVTYVATLAPPPPRPRNEKARAGGRIFEEIGCAHCHRETLTTGTVAGAPERSNRVIHPFTDLLLHDMGPGLADGRADFAAGGNDWRTAPLWGIGLTSIVADKATYLHDGRARNLTEAILWHGGEGKAARDRFAALSRDLRGAVLAFLETL